MPFQKGKPKTGGRKKGSGIPLPQIRRDVAEKLAELGFDPIIRMVQIASDPKCPEDRVARICDSLARYVHPQRKAVEHSGLGGGPIELSNVTGYELLLSRINRVAARIAEAPDIKRAD
ncbi:MAG: hypothetical protein V4555_17815 [Acidobacteriota bacterium]